MIKAEMKIRVSPRGKNHTPPKDNRKEVYGIAIGEDYRSLFKGYDKIYVNIDGIVYQFDISRPSFSNRCCHFDDTARNTPIRDFLEKHHLTNDINWPSGTPPDLQLTILGDAHFCLEMMPTSQSV
ncbi:hypothetical protein HZU77_015780 [Neisseriaceae bacterium TC5R-5]|nr:hypothetical protein [Neisseriaceae bacterium TC5R-5]